MYSNTRIQKGSIVMGNANRISPQSTTTTEQCILTSAAASRIHVVQHVRIHIPAAIPKKIYTQLQYQKSDLHISEKCN